MIDEVKLERIEKRFRNGFTALKNISICIKRGEGPIGLLGPNGAGKTTLLRIIATVFPQTSGRILVNGSPLEKFGLNEYRRRTGYLPQRFGVYKTLTPEEFLVRIGYLYYGKGFEKSRLKDVMEIFGIEDYKNRPLSRCSGGMIQRVGMAMCLLNDPDFFILDEPFTGLDPIERLKAMKVITKISREKIVLFSTHIISEIQNLCSRVIIIHKGRIIMDGRIDELLKNIEGKVYEVTTSHKNMEEIEDRYEVLRIKNEGENMCIRVYSDLPLKNLKQVIPTLEDLYYLGIKHGE